MELSEVQIVLVRPARAANVAAACRALKNMGLGPPVLVGEPPLGLDEPDARNLAYGAWDVLDARRTVATLAEAVGGCVLVAGTTARPLADAWAPRRLAEESRRLSGPLAVVFGPEASGLDGDELDRCHVRVRVPTDASHPSLNLAQAVLLMAYELRLALVTEVAPVDEPAASSTEVEGALTHLREALLAIGYLNVQNPDAVLAELRRLAARARLAHREVTLLHGLARQVLWAAGQGSGRRLAEP